VIGRQLPDDWRHHHALGADPGVISALVLEELAHRSVLGWLRDG